MNLFKQYLFLHKLSKKKKKVTKPWQVPGAHKCSNMALAFYWSSNKKILHQN